MNESILNTIKKMLGLSDDYTAFDTDIIVHINSCFMKLNQLGVGPEQPFMITGNDETWISFFGEDTDVEAAKTYIYINVKLVFDPPTSSFVVEALKEIEKGYEWRLMVQREQPVEEEGGEEDE